MCACLDEPDSVLGRGAGVARSSRVRPVTRSAKEMACGARPPAVPSEASNLAPRDLREPHRNSPHPAALNAHQRAAIVARATRSRHRLLQPRRSRATSLQRLEELLNPGRTPEQNDDTAEPFPRPPRSSATPASMSKPDTMVTGEASGGLLECREGKGGLDGCLVGRVLSKRVCSSRSQLSR